jgi:hypothetical protein
MGIVFHCEVVTLRGLAKGLVPQLMVARDFGVSGGVGS